MNILTLIPRNFTPYMSANIQIVPLPPKPVVSVFQPWLPEFTEADERNIRAFLAQPISIQLAGCSFSFPVNISKLFSELQQFAQQRLNLDFLELEVFGPTVWKALGTSYIVRLLASANCTIPLNSRYPIEEQVWPFCLRFCLPSAVSDPSVLPTLKQECLRIIGSQMPFLGPTQVQEGEASLRRFGIPFTPHQSAMDFRITLAETLFERTNCALKIDFAAIPRNEAQAAYYLPVRNYLPFMEEEKSFAAPPPLKFTREGFLLFCEGAIHALTVGVQKPKREPGMHNPKLELLAYHPQFTLAQLPDFLREFPSQWQASSPEEKELLINNLELNLAALAQKSDLEKSAVFNCFAPIFQSNERCWGQIFSAPDRPNLNLLACELADYYLRGKKSPLSFFTEIFTCFLVRSVPVNFTVLLCKTLGAERVASDLAKVLKKAEYQRNVNFLLLELSKDKKQFLFFLYQLMDQFRGQKLQPIVDTCLFLCEALQEGDGELVAEIWIKATEANFWTSEEHRQKQVEIFIGLSGNVEKPMAQRLLSITAGMAVSGTLRRRFETACRALQDRISEKHAESTPGNPRELSKQQMDQFLQDCERPLQSKESLIERGKALVREMSALTFSRYNPLEARKMAVALLFKPVVLQLFVEANREEQWHELLLFIANETKQTKGVEWQEVEPFLCKLFNDTLDRSMIPKSKDNLLAYHLFWMELIGRHSELRAVKKAQGDLIGRILQRITPLFQAYRTQELHQEGCQLLLTMHVHGTLVCDEESCVIAPLELLVDRLNKQPQDAQLFADIEMLLAKVPFLTRSLSRPESIAKQKELYFLLAKGFVVNFPEKSWQFFERLVSCYPAVLIEPEFAYEMAVLAEKLYQKKGFSVLTRLLKAFKQGQSADKAVYWEHFFGAMLEHLLKQGRIHDMYEVLWEGLSIVPKKVLKEYAAAWVHVALSRPLEDSQRPKITQISEMLRLYSINEPKLWRRFFQKAKGIPGIDLWQELQAAEACGLATDFAERKKCWQIALSHSKRSQLLPFLLHKEIILTLFNNDFTFFIEFMQVILDHLKEQNRTYRKEFSPKLQELHDAVCRFEATEVQRAYLYILSQEILLIQNPDSLPSDSQMTELGICFTTILNSNDPPVQNQFTFLDFYIKRVVRRLIAIKTEKQSSRFQVIDSLELKFVEVLRSLFCKRLPTSQWIEHLSDILPLIELGAIEATDYLFWWQDFIQQRQQEMIDNKEEPNYQNLRKAFYWYLLGALPGIKRPNVFIIMSGLATYKDNHVLFTDEEQADLLASLCVAQLTSSPFEYMTHIEISAAPIIFKSASRHYKESFSCCLFKVYSTGRDKMANSQSFVNNVEMVHKLLTSQKESSREVEFEFLNYCLGFILYNAEKLGDFSLPLLEFATNKFKRFVEIATDLAKGSEVDKIFENLIITKASLEPIATVVTFLEEMRTKFLFFQQKEQELFALYVYLLRVNTKVVIPIEKFSLKAILPTLSLAIPNYLGDETIPAIQRVELALNLLRACQKGTFDKMSAGIDQDLTVLFTIYESLLNYIQKLIHADLENSEGTKFPLIGATFTAISELIAHIEANISQKPIEVQKALAFFIVQVALYFLSTVDTIQVAQTEKINRLQVAEKINKKINVQSLAIHKGYLYLVVLGFARNLNHLSTAIFTYSSQIDPKHLPLIKERIKNWLSRLLSYENHPALPNVEDKQEWRKYVVCIAENANKFHFPLFNAEEMKWLFGETNEEKKAGTKKGTTKRGKKR